METKNYRRGFCCCNCEKSVNDADTFWIEKELENGTWQEIGPFCEKCSEELYPTSIPYGKL